MIKKITFAGAIIIVNCTFAFSQSQATTSKQTDKDGIQCSSSGVGIGKNNQEAADTAEKNRELAEQKARKKRKKSRSSFTNEKGGGIAICQKYTNATSDANFKIINEGLKTALQFDCHKTNIFARKIDEYVV